MKRSSKMKRSKVHGWGVYVNDPEYRHLHYVYRDKSSAREIMRRLAKSHPYVTYSLRPIELSPSQIRKFGHRLKSSHAEYGDQ